MQSAPRPNQAFHIQRTLRGGSLGRVPALRKHTGRADEPAQTLVVVSQQSDATKRNAIPVSRDQTKDHTGKGCRCRCFASFTRVLYGRAYSISQQTVFLSAGSLQKHPLQKIDLFPTTFRLRLSDPESFVWRGKRSYGRGLRNGARFPEANAGSRAWKDTWRSDVGVPQPQSAARREYRRGLL